MYNNYKKLFRQGNLKIGKDTSIYNISSAALGLCKNVKYCYAAKAERLYPQVLPFRRAQTTFWDDHSAFEFAMYIRAIIRRKKDAIKYLRLNEAGDFRNMHDVRKVTELARLIPEIKIYTYTHRVDLVRDFERAAIKLPANLNINISDTHIPGYNSFNVYNPRTGETTPRGAHICPGDCRTCKVCTIKPNPKNGGKKIYVEKH